VWAFLGDGETDEPESLGRDLPRGREKLDNLVFVVNCNLSASTGPCAATGRSSGARVSFRGAGWNVLMEDLGHAPGSAARARTPRASCAGRKEEAVDGEYQAYKARDGAYVREHFFGAYPIVEMVEDMSDEIGRSNRGGHDPHKVYAAYAAGQHDGASRR
jgi:pyruvate dehydrogenase E1 component